MRTVIKVLFESLPPVSGVGTLNTCFLIHGRA